VFAFECAPVKQMLNSAWKKARARVGLDQVRMHDIKHPFGRRLRAAGLSIEDRQDLLGHHSGRITSHYSAAELSRLIGSDIRCASEMAAGQKWSSCAESLRLVPAKVPPSGSGLEGAAASF